MNLTSDLTRDKYNQQIVNEILQSGKSCCFDESLLRTQEGCNILKKLRITLGSKRLFYQKDIEQRLPQKTAKDKRIYREVKELLSSMRLEVGPGNSPFMVTADINLAEYLGNRSGHKRIYILTQNGKLRNWQEVRDEKLGRAINLLGNTLIDKKCWIASSALASARINRFAEVLTKLPEITRSQVIALDISISKAMKNQRIADSVRHLSSLCTAPKLKEIFPAASEEEMLALAITHSDKKSTLLTIWNDAEQAKKVYDLANTTARAKLRLQNVAFCQLSWAGQLEPLEGFNGNNLARELFDSGEQTPAEPDTGSGVRLQLRNIAHHFNLQPKNLVTRLLKHDPKHIANQLDVLTLDQIAFICKQNPQPTPDDALQRTLGPKLGKRVAQCSLEEIENDIGDDPMKRELAIIYARRWEKLDILRALLDEADILSPYCFNNWFKRSQNTGHNLKLEDLMLDNSYYQLLHQVIDKSLYLENVEDAIAKLQLLQRSAIITEVRNRARIILDKAAARGAKTAG